MQARRDGHHDRVTRDGEERQYESGPADIGCTMSGYVLADDLELRLRDDERHGS